MKLTLHDIKYFLLFIPVGVMLLLPKACHTLLDNVTVECFYPSNYGLAGLILIILLFPIFLIFKEEPNKKKKAK